MAYELVSLTRKKLSSFLSNLPQKKFIKEVMKLERKQRITANESALIIKNLGKLPIFIEEKDILFDLCFEKNKITISQLIELLEAMNLP